MLIGLKTADTFSVATPADWRPGDEVIVPPAGSCGVAKDRMEGKEEMTCCDWYFCTKKIDEEKVLAAVLKKQSRVRPRGGICGDDTTGSSASRFFTPVAWGESALASVCKANFACVVNGVFVGVMNAVRDLILIYGGSLLRG